MNEQIKKYIRAIRIASNVGLWGSVAVSLAAILFYYLSDYRFYMDNRHYSLFMYVGSLLILIDAMFLLLAVRKQMPRIRQTEGVEERFRLFSRQIQTLYYVSLAVVLIECAIIVLSNNNSLIMFLLILVVMLILLYPNIYRMQVHMGLSDQEMTDIFGDRFIPDMNQQESLDEHHDNTDDTTHSVN